MFSPNTTNNFEIIKKKHHFLVLTIITSQFVSFVRSCIILYIYIMLNEPSLNTNDILAQCKTQTL